MKTRTLLLLALGCGVAIMLSGAVFLVQLSGQDEPVPPVPLGEVATAGDMDVVVVAAAERDGLLDVTVRIGGVDDPDGASGFRLIAAGRAVRPLADGGADTPCAATTIAEQTCTLRFDVSVADGESRVLFYERGDDRLRWELA